MAKKIQVIVDVESESVNIASDKTLTLTQQIRILRQELQKTPEGTKEFNLLVTKLNDTQDALGRVNIKGKEVFGTLGLIPGPIGDIAARANSAIDALKVFGSLKTSDLQSQLKALSDDFKDVGATIFRLTGLQKLYVTTTRSVSQGLQAMGVSIQTASTAAKAFAGTLAALTAATGIILVTTLISQLSEAYEYFSTKAERAAEAQKKLEESIQKGNKAALDAETAFVKRSGELLTAQAKARGASAKEIYEIDQRNKKLLVESLERYYNNIQNKDSDAAIQALTNLKDAQNSIKVAEAEFQAEQLKTKQEAGKKLTEAEKQRLEKENQDRLQALENIAKNEKAAALSLLDERDQEKRKIIDDYNEKINLAAANNKDTLILEEAKLKALADLNDKFAKEDLDKAKKDADDKKKEIEDANKVLLDAETTANELRYAQGLQSEEEYQAALYQIKLKYATTETERQQAEIEFLEFAKGKQKEYEDTVKSANKALTDSYISLASNIGTSFTEIARLFEQGSDLQKTFAIIGVLVNAAASIGKIKTSTAEAIADFSKTIATGTATIASGAALLTNPITAAVGAAQVAAGKAAVATGTAGIATAKTASTVQQVGVGVSAAAQIAAITSAGKSGTSSATTSGGGNTSGAQAPTPTFNGTVAVPAPQIGASTASQSGTLATTIAGAVVEGNSKSRPIQTYVVGDQITTQQQLDRRISAAARMAG